MKTADAKKLNLDINAIYEKPSFEMTFEQQDEAVVKLIQRRFESYAKELTRMAWTEIRRDWKCKKKFDQWYDEFVKEI